jgi:hypothetical protein
MIYNLHQ